MEVTPSLINFVFTFLSNAKTMSCVMSEWLLFNANWAIFQLCHGENKLIFNEMMNMRGDEGDSESERYTSWFDRCGFLVSNPLLHNTTWARRDIPFFWILKHWKHGLENWIFRHYWVPKLNKYHYKQRHIAVCP